MADHLFDDLWRMVDQVVHPRLRGREKLFSRAALFGTIVVFGVPLVFATPWLSAWVGCKLAPWMKVAITRDDAMQLCDWFAIFFQIAIFAAIGGVAFTQKFASDIEKSIGRWRDDLVANEYEREGAASEERQRQMRELEKLLKSNESYANKTWAVIRMVRGAVADTNTAYYRYVWFATKGLALNFPGGLYGLLGFLFLVGQIYALSGKIVLDHLPEVCRW